MRSGRVLGAAGWWRGSGVGEGPTGSKTKNPSINRQRILCTPHTRTALCGRAHLTALRGARLLLLPCYAPQQEHGSGAPLAPGDIPGQSRDRARDLGILRLPMGSTPKGSRWDIPTASVPAVAAQGHPTYRDLSQVLLKIPEILSEIW